MKRLSILFKQPLYYLLVLVPLVIVGEFLHWNEVLIFIASVLGIVPLAKLLGDATEALAAHTSPRIGGLLNATLGNAAELIITIVALRAGLNELVKASITGSILGNLLLIMGAALFLGGLRNGVQRFNRTSAGLAASQMALAVIALAIPTIFARSGEFAFNHHAVELMSESVAVVMLSIYVLSLIFTFRSPAAAIAHPEQTHDTPWSLPLTLGILAIATFFIAWLSEILVGVVEPTIEALGLSEFFIGIIIIPLVGNAAEHLVAVTVAMKDQMELSMSISLGSSMQIALFVAPLLVFISLFIGPEPLDLIFHPFELAALGAATVIAAIIALDGESNWMEGVQLLGVFLIIAIAFFFLPR